MPLPQHIGYGQGGLVFVDLRTRPTNAQLTIVRGDGTRHMGPVNASILAVDTVLNAAGSRGDYDINVANAANLANSVRCWITDDPEEILVESASGGTITLRRPLLRDHALNAAVQGTRVSYTVSANEANTAFWDGRLECNVDGGAEFVYVGIECTKYPVQRLATVQNLYDEQPNLQRLAIREEDWERSLDRGLEEVLKRIAKADPNLRARVYPASREVIDATVYATLMNYYRRISSDEGSTLYERYRKELLAEVETFCGTAPADRDQDGVVEQEDRVTPRTLKLRRG